MIDFGSVVWNPIAGDAWIAAGAAAALAAVVVGAVRARSASAWLAALVRVVAVAALVLLALRPAVPEPALPAAWSDTDVYLVFDATASMGAIDGGDDDTTRLEAAQRDAIALLDRLAAEGARASLIAFQREARVVVPLTTDLSAVARGVASLEPEYTTGAAGTDIAVAAATVVDTVSAQQELHPERSSLVVYLGDGENTAASTGDFTALGAVIQGAVVLGYGTAEGAAMNGSQQPGAAPPKYLRDPATGDIAASALDATRLTLVAERLGGDLVIRSEEELPRLSEPSRRAAPPTEDGLRAGTEDLSWRIAGVLLVALLVDLAVTLVAVARAGLPWRHRP